MNFSRTDAYYGIEERKIVDCVWRMHVKQGDMTAFCDKGSTRGMQLPRVHVHVYASARSILRGSSMYSLMRTAVGRKVSTDHLYTTRGR